MSRAGESARREYERRVARDRARIDSNRRQRVAVLAVTPIVVFCAVRFAGPWAWDGFVSAVLSSTDSESPAPTMDARQLTIPAAVVALAATLSVWQQLFGRRQTTEASRQGAEGEAMTARILARLPAGYVVMHDLPMPRSRANVDHVVIGPTGVFTIETKRYKNGVSIQRGHVRASGRDRSGIVEQANRQAQAMGGAFGVPARPVVVVHGGVTLGWFTSPVVDGVRFCSPGKLRKVVTNGPATLSPDEVNAAVERVAGSGEREPWVPIGPASSDDPVEAQHSPAQPPAAGGCSCGGDWVERRRRADGIGFLGCSRFPACRRTRSLS